MACNTEAPGIAEVLADPEIDGVAIAGAGLSITINWSGRHWRRGKHVFGRESPFGAAAEQEGRAILAEIADSRFASTHGSATSCSITLQFLS